MGIFPRLNKSICGCSLETGTKIIGWFSVTVHTLVFIFYLKQYIRVEKGLDYAGKEEILGYLIAMEVFLVIRTITDVLLIIGIYNRRPSYIFVWIIVGSLSIIITLIWTIMSLLQTLQSFVAAQRIVSVAIGYYFIVIVNGHYEDLKSSIAGVQ